jgi:uncharacterized membrane protein
MPLTDWFARGWRSFSFVGLATAALFFAASLSPSLLPRHFAVQGLLSGFALAVGYGVGVFGVWLWLYLEFREPSERTQFLAKRITAVAVTVVAASFLWREVVWQNSIRALMGMEPVATTYPWRVGAIALVAGVLLVLFGRGIRKLFALIDRQIERVVPPRVSRVVSAMAVVTLIVLVANNVIARVALNMADSVFSEMDRHIDEDIAQPTAAEATGSSESLIAWDTVGRRGKDFVAAGPTRDEIAEFLGADAKQPLRIYVGLSTRETIAERARLALDELIRVHAFDRKILIVATPTGTGWLDPGAVDTIEYLHAGDTAIVSMQYSYLPSWITILVDPTRSRESARALFEEVYAYWTTLPHDKRPQLYLHGLSLGALGSSASADLFTVFEDPIQGGVWSGPPFPSAVWQQATAARNPDTPQWLPQFRDGSMIRFTGRENALPQQGKRWGPMRFVYIQHPSDPMGFFSPDLLYRRPQWLIGERGPDVTPYLEWYPIVTFLQVAFDLPMATTVPFGYGHNFAASSYIDAWIEVTQPADWSDELTERLKEKFVARGR